MEIEAQLKKARQNLLDLTMGNRLLNYRPTKMKTIGVVDGDPRETFKRLVLQERTMEFRPQKEDQLSIKSSETLSSEGSTLDHEEYSSHSWSIWSESDSLETRESSHTDGFLQTALDSERLDQKLLHVSRQAYTVLEEQGYNALFLALGYLEWFESSTSKKGRRAPLVLVPVELERKKVTSAFKLGWTGEDVQSNISLQAKLIEQGITLPIFEVLDSLGN